MPVGSRGPFGYPDYQRADNWDSPLALSASFNPATEGFESGVINCSRYSYIVLGVTIRGFEAAAPARFILQWSTNFAASPAVLSEVAFTHALSGSLTAGKERLVVIACRGPLCKVKLLQPSGSPKGTIHLSAAFTNRVVETPYPIISPILISTNISVNSVARGSVTPTFPYAGPMNVAVFLDGAEGAVAVELQALSTESGEFVIVDNLQAEKQVWLRGELLAPLGDWRIAILNASGSEKTFGVLVSPSVTGA